MEKREGSSMVAEFTRAEDIKQACYEATVDITVYMGHLENIAKRCENNFPEIAAGLRGTAAGIGQNLHGVTGEWRTPANEDLRAAVSLEDFHEHMWAYEFSRDPRGGVVLLGCMAAVAAAKPDLNFWEVMKIARVKLSDMEPLIEQLLQSSPRRAQ